MIVISVKDKVVFSSDIAYTPATNDTLGSFDYGILVQKFHLSRGTQYQLPISF